MPRNFANNGLVTCTTGALATLDGGPVTMACIIKLTDSVNGAILYAGTSTSSVSFAMEIFGNNYGFTTSAGGQNCVGGINSDNWHMAAVSKASGTATPRGHKYVYGTDAWTHSNAAGTLADAAAAPGAGGVIQLGRYATTEYINADIAIIGCWDRVLTDAETELLPFSLQSWYHTAPVGLWILDQAAIGTKVLDATGNGASESSLTVTSVSTESVPVFSYGFGGGITAGHSSGGAGPVAVGQAVETDTATAVGRSKRRILSAGVETDAAQPVSRAKARPLGAVTETDTARAVGRVKGRTVTAAVEADTAVPVGRVKQRTLGTAVESGSAQPLARTKVRAVAVAVETDSARGLTRAKTASAAPAVESDAAPLAGRTKTRLLGVAVDTDTAMPVSNGGHVVPAGVAAEADTAGTLPRLKSRTVGQAAESDTALLVAGVKARTVGVAGTIDTTSPVGAAKRCLVGVATEAGSALPVVSPLRRMIGAATETDAAMPVTLPLGTVVPATYLRTRSSTGHHRASTTTGHHRTAIGRPWHRPGTHGPRS